MLTFREMLAEYDGALDETTVLVAVGTVWLRARTRRIAASRPGESFDTFRASFAPDEAPPDVLPSGFNDFADHVIPELQRRGLFRTEYDGTTLREHLGLGLPKVPAAAYERCLLEPAR